MGTRNVTLRVNTPRTAQQEWAAAFASFTNRCEGENLSPGTLRFYRFKLAVFAGYVEQENLALADVTAQHLRDLIAQQVKRTSAQNAKHIYRAVATFFNHLVADGWLEASPTTGMSAPKVERKIIPSLTPDQVQAVLDTCGRDFIGIRDRLIVLLLVDAGIRAKELLGITYADLDVESGRVLVLGKGRRQREVYFGQATQQVMRTYMQWLGECQATDPVFINCYREKLAYRSLAGMLQRRGEKAKLPPGLCHAHAFRHTAALLYLRRGGDPLTLRRLLGHSSLWMTEQYVELTRDDVADKHKSFSPGDLFAQSMKPTTGRKRLR